MSAAYKAVCQKLLLKDSAQPSDLCCLCLKQVDSTSAVSVNDKIAIEVDQNGNSFVEERMARILVDIIGETVVQTMGMFESICKQCSIDSIASFKFMRRCRENIDNLVRAVDDFDSCFENVAEDLNEYQSLYISVNPKEMTIQQFYDTKRQTNPSETALKRFHFIAYGIPRSKTAPDGSTTRVNRDFSTIFIKTHELVHDPSKPKEYKCKICLKLYPTSGNLRQHFFAHHFKKEFQCEECPKSFGTAGLLQTHITVSHCTVECAECGKTLLNRTSTLKRHALTHSKTAKICFRCGRHYKKGKDFEKHMAQETCEMPSRIPGNFQCDNCSYHCHYKHQLTSHIKFEHGDAKGHICKWCGRRCYSASALKTHILKHTKERNFICTDCGGKFVTKQSLTHHQRLHTGERPYKCTQCDQSFLSASRRNDHIERYHNTTSFDCDLCDAKYNARRSLMKHKRRHAMEDVIIGT
ncbi:hypothetical protein O0L34_g10256 [Tuta absoluta]|nr:hypothetical protein O0L34_g10256 [Tuta absoluta]